MARRILAEPRNLTPADRAVGLDARRHPSRVLLGRTGTPDYRRPGRPQSSTKGASLPGEFATLRRLLEARMDKRGKHEYVQVLRLLKTFEMDHVQGAMPGPLGVSWRCAVSSHASAALGQAGARSTDTESQQCMRG